MHYRIKETVDEMGMSMFYPEYKKRWFWHSVTERKYDGMGVCIEPIVRRSLREASDDLATRVKYDERKVVIHNT